MKKSYFIILLLLLLQGCFYQNRIQHLASDVCLIKENIEKEDVVRVLGRPVVIRKTEEGAEKWIYYTSEKSFLRSLPFFGERFKWGHEKFHVATVVFSGDNVIECVYRFLDSEDIIAIIGSGKIDE